MAGRVGANENSLVAPIDDRQFRELAENIPTLCWIADAEGYILWYNRRWYDYTGKTPSEMEGWGWQSVHDPKTLPEVLERWSTAIGSARPFEMVFPIRGADGVLRPFRWYEYTGAPIGSTDGEAWSAVLHPDDRDRVLASWELAVRSGAPFHVECRLRNRSGGYLWTLARAQAERDSAGAIARWYGACAEIEEIVQARQILERSRDELERAVAASTGERNLLARIVETSDVMIMALDLDYRILAINKANADEFERVYGVRPKIGDDMLALIADQPEQRAAAQAAWARALAGEEITLVEPHGDPARARSCYEINFRTLTGEAGERIGAFQFVYDVTEKLRDQARLAQAQEALRQAQKLEAMGQLTGGVAHDFNNLLTPIIGSLDLLARRRVGGAREQRLIHAAGQSAERAKVLVQRLLAFARRQPLQSTSVDLAAVVAGLRVGVDLSDGVAQD
ncbi:MAG: PAS domain-containing protein [Roseiarcus sp.]